MQLLIGRLKQFTEIVCHDIINQLNTTTLSESFDKNIKFEIGLKFANIWKSNPIFLSNGFNIANLKQPGTTQELIERLTILVITGRITDTHSLRTDDGRSRVQWTALNSRARNQTSNMIFGDSLKARQNTVWWRRDVKKLSRCACRTVQ